MKGWLETAGMDWFQVKLFIKTATAVHPDALHILLAVLALLAIAALIRRPVASLWPWLAVLVLELLNEASDMAHERWPDPGHQWGESAKDVVVTMALPTLLMLLARWRPGLFNRR